MATQSVLARPQTAMIGYDEPNAIARLAQVLQQSFHAADAPGPITVVAIGSDRTTGDCLGPLVGEYLLGSPAFQVIGTLDDPVHAANMHDALPMLGGFAVAVDAALGAPVGGIAVREGALSPGAAFGRDLPAIGDMSISALMCESGAMGFERLRSVRLSFVRRVAHVIATALHDAALLHLHEHGDESSMTLDIATLERQLQS